MKQPGPNVIRESAFTEHVRLSFLIFPQREKIEGSKQPLFARMSSVGSLLRRILQTRRGLEGDNSSITNSFSPTNVLRMRGSMKTICIFKGETSIMRWLPNQLIFLVRIRNGQKFQLLFQN